jgi:hypothetical protein
MPHMLDKHIIEEMQERWSEQFDITSSHHFRAGDDMQYSFSYFYYLMHAVILSFRPTKIRLAPLDLCGCRSTRLAVGDGKRSVG